MSGDPGRKLETEFRFRQPLNGFVLLRNDLRLPCYGQRQNTHGHRTQGENDSQFLFRWQEYGASE